MHFHADHALFFERRRSLPRVAATIGVVVAVLLVNAGAHSGLVSSVGAGVGGLLLLHAHTLGHRRLEPALAWVMVLVAGALVGGLRLGDDAGRVAQAAARIACGVVWVLWLGTQVDWASLRSLLLAARVPEAVVATLDHALLHGVLTRREWSRRLDAARMRLGKARLPLTAVGPLLGEGALHAFHRLERVEENALMRSDAGQPPSTGDPFRLDAVGVERGGRLVLEQVDLQLHPGEWVLVCGPSGAGKSSLLRLLAGLDGPAHGRMTRLGEVVLPDATLADRLDGRVALLNQNPEHHFIASTVAEDIEWGLLQRGVDASEARRRCVEVAGSLGLQPLLERACHTLSFGEQRRVALAGLLVLDPAVLLLDEPTAGLDPVTAHELRVLVEQTVRTTGAACVWATHDLHTVPPLVRRVVLIRDGRVRFDGPANEGLSRPWLLRAGLAVPHETSSPHPSKRNE